MTEEKVIQTVQEQEVKAPKKSEIALGCFIIVVLIGLVIWGAYAFFFKSNPSENSQPEKTAVQTESPELTQEDPLTEKIRSCLKNPEDAKIIIVENSAFTGIDIVTPLITDFGKRMMQLQALEDLRRVTLEIKEINIDRKKTGNELFSLTYAARARFGTEEDNMDVVVVTAEASPEAIRKISDDVLRDSIPQYFDRFWMHGVLLK